MFVWQCDVSFKHNYRFIVEFDRSYSGMYFPLLCTFVIIAQCTVPCRSFSYFVLVFYGHKIIITTNVDEFTFWSSNLTHNHVSWSQVKLFDQNKAQVALLVHMCLFTRISVQEIWAKVRFSTSLLCAIVLRGGDWVSGEKVNTCQEAEACFSLLWWE